MKNVTPLLLLVGSLMGATTQQTGQQQDSKKAALQLICETAKSKLHESGTIKIALTLVVDEQGKVESFKTESPKRLRLEKMKEAAEAVKSLRFEPAKEGGRPVKVVVPMYVACSYPTSGATKKP